MSQCFILTMKTGDDYQQALALQVPTGSLASFVSPHHPAVFCFSTPGRQSVLRPKVALSYQPLGAATRTRKV